MMVVIKGIVDHDGRRYEAGQALDLADDQAQALLDAAAAELAPDGAELANAPVRKGKAKD